MKTSDLLVVYKTLSYVMDTNGLKMDTSFIRVKNYIANMICDQLYEGDTI